MGRKLYSLRFSSFRPFIQEGQHRLNEWLEKRTLNVCTFSMENLRALIVTVCEFISTASSHCNPPSPQFETLMENQVKAQIQELVQNWIETLETHIEPGLAATAANWAIYGLASHWSHDRSKERPSPDTFAEQVLPLIAANLRLVELPEEKGIGWLSNKHANQ